jgi:hypothetical protein
VLESVRQPLGALGSLLRDARGYRPRDGEEFRLDAGADPSRALAEQPIKAPDGPLQAYDRVALVLLAPGLEVDEDSHARILDRGSDISVEETQVTWSIRSST